MFYKFFGYATALLCALGTVTVPKFISHFIMGITNIDIAIITYIVLTIAFAIYTGMVITRTVELTINDYEKE